MITIISSSCPPGRLTLGRVRDLSFVVRKVADNILAELCNVVVVVVVRSLIV